MISRFGTLFVGTVEHPDMGFDASAVNDRWYEDSDLATPMGHAEDLAAVLEAAGFDTMWLAEHHFQREGYECLPNALLMATHLAGRTERLRFGCGFNILPMWHPLRLAEDYSMADILTRGRVRLGVGRGYHAREVQTFGAPFGDMEASREMFEEQVDLLMKALKERSFSHRGRFYNLPPAIEYRGYELEELTLVPKPQHPIECWQPIVSGSERGMDFMIRHGIKGFVGGGATSGGASNPVISSWQKKLAEAGRGTELGTDLMAGISFVLADTEAEAMRLGRPMMEEYQKMFAPLGFAGVLTDEQIELISRRETASLAGLPTVEEAVDAGAWICGPPQLLIDRIAEIQELYPGMNELMVSQPVGARHSFVCEQMQRFGEEVLPAFIGES